MFPQSNSYPSKAICLLLGGSKLIPLPKTLLIPCGESYSSMACLDGLRLKNVLCNHCTVIFLLLTFYYHHSKFSQTPNHKINLSTLIYVEEHSLCTSNHYCISFNNILPFLTTCSLITTAIWLLYKLLFLRIVFFNFNRHFLILIFFMFHIAFDIMDHS